jgi:D-3-phosphoglycerate dehydrogenase
MPETKNILITFPYDPHIIPGYDEYVAEFEQKGFKVFLDPRYRRLVPDETIEALQEHNAYAHVLTGEKITNNVLEACPAVKIFVKMGAGSDMFDLGACTKHGVVAATTPGGNAEAVAEHTLAMMLALTRHIVILDAKMRQGLFNKAFGTCMFCKTLGIIGFGAIGKKVAKFVSGFDMSVLVYDVYQDKKTAAKYGCTFVPLKTLLKESDFITMHAPLLDSTVGMIGVKEFDLMKSETLFCNCARGGLVDEQALVGALKSGKIRGAALDAFTEEPLPLSSELYKLDNVILSPHTAGVTYEARGKILQMAFQNVLELSEGKVPYGIVNKELYKK